MNIPKQEDFLEEIVRLKMDAKEVGGEWIDINAGVLHSMLGDFKGKDARMYTCCRAMYACMNPKDQVIQLPTPRAGNTETKGFGSRLTIRYFV